MNLNKVCQVLLVFFTLWTLELPCGDAILPVIDLFSFKKHFLGWDGGGGWGWGGYYAGPEKLVTKLIFLKLLAIKQTLLLAAPPLALGAMAIGIGAKIVAVQLTPFVLLHLALKPLKDKIHKHKEELHSAVLQPFKIFQGGGGTGGGHGGHGGHRHPHVFYGIENFAPDPKKSFWQHWLVRLGRVNPFNPHYRNVPRGWLSPRKNKVSQIHHVYHDHPPPPIHGDEGGWTYSKGPGPPGPPPDYSIFEGPPPHYSHEGSSLPDDTGGGWTYHKHRDESQGWTDDYYIQGQGHGQGHTDSGWSYEPPPFIAKGPKPYKNSGQGYEIGHYGGGNEESDGYSGKSQKFLPPPVLPSVPTAAIRPKIIKLPRFKRQTNPPEPELNVYAESEQFLENQLSLSLGTSNPVQADALKQILREAATGKIPQFVPLPEIESFSDNNFNRRSSNEESKEKVKSSSKERVRPTRAGNTNTQSRAEFAAKMTQMSKDIELFFTLVSAFDQNTCLEKLVCEIHAKGQGSTFSEHETNIIDGFRLLKILSVVEATNPMTTKYRRAAAIGERSRQSANYKDGLDQGETCSKVYTKCDYKCEEIIEMGNNLEKVSNTDARKASS